MSEHQKRANARKLLAKSGYGKMGGHFKKGGAVKDVVKSGVAQHESHDHKGEPKTKLKLKDGGCADGGAPAARADRLKRGGKPKHSKTVVNVVVGGQQQPKPIPVPVPVPGGPGGGPPPGAMAGPGGPPPPPDMPPPGAGGPPMGLKSGGRAKRDTGGVASGADVVSPKASNSQRDPINGMPAGHFKKGGKASAKYPVPMDSGAGGGKGRLEKIKDYG